MIINSISGGKTSCFLSWHFPADVDLFALVEQQCAIYNPAQRWWTSDAQREAFEWVRRYRSGFWSTAEDDRTLICMHELSKELAGRATDWTVGGDRQGVVVVAAGNTSGLTNPITGKKASTFDDFDTLIAQRNFLPNARKRLCTQYLKVEALFHHICWHYGQEVRKGPVFMRIGFRPDEIERTVGLYFRYTKKEGRVPKPDYDLTSSFRRWRLPAYLKRWWEVLEVEKAVRTGVLVEKPVPFNVVGGLDYRTPDFPLIEQGISHGEIVRFWRDKVHFPFPEISNCVGCFHHRVEQLQQQWHDEANWGKMEWYARQEEAKDALFGKTLSYRQIQKLGFQQAINFNSQWSSCDSGSCTD